VIGAISAGLRPRPQDSSALNARLYELALRQVCVCVHSSVRVCIYHDVCLFVCVCVRACVFVCVTYTLHFFILLQTRTCISSHTERAAGEDIGGADNVPSTEKMLV
jgi:hypothetical protein